MGHDDSEKLFHYLKSREKLPDALLCGNDSIALGVMNVAKDLGLKIPEDLSIIGMDDTIYGTLSRPQHSFHVFDMILWAKVVFQKNLDLYLNCHMYETFCEEGKIKSITALQSTTEIIYHFEADYFSDNTGDGTLGALAGADYTIGHESKSEFNESLAPLEVNSVVMGSTVLFGTMDTGKPTPFARPEWAYEFNKKTLGKRAIKHLTHGYWWIELDGEIEESEDIMCRCYP